MDYARLPNNIETTNLILQQLIRMLVEKELLSDDDVWNLLFKAAEHADIVGSELTPNAARDFVRDELLPAIQRQK